MIQKETLFGPAHFLVKEDIYKTIRKVKDVAFERCEKLVPTVVEIFSNPTVKTLNFEECIKFMMYCVVFFQEKQGFSGYKLRGPVRGKHVDYHILSKITPDATDRTKKSNATKFQIFQLTIRELSRMHCLN